MPESDLTEIVRRAPYYTGTTDKLVTRTRIPGSGQSRKIK